MSVNVQKAAERTEETGKAAAEGGTAGAEKTR
jgi:hypothetical protein